VKLGAGASAVASLTPDGGNASFICLTSERKHLNCRLKRIAGFPLDVHALLLVGLLHGVPAGVNVGYTIGPAALPGLQLSLKADGFGFVLWKVQTVHCVCVSEIGRLAIKPQGFGYYPRRRLLQV